ncbi:MAG: SMP-30/gluconolactonase/LRE family protein [Pseudomonadales bacterium]|nr:SMP-30/gluconolactonase/LRE family protein [Pseudomonadales bacterium]
MIGHQLRAFATLLVVMLSTNVMADDCQPTDGLTFLCGPVNGEDLVWIGQDQMIASGMANEEGTGRIYFIDTQSHSYTEIYPGEAPANEFDEAAYPGCPGAPDPATFSSHGLALLPLGQDKYRLYATGHIGREAVEILELDNSGLRPSLTWIGCVEMPDGASINSVVALSDGGFLTTRISGMTESGDIFAGEISGFLYEWHPGGVIERVFGTEMSGPNGIVVSEDEATVYVASWGRKEIAKFARQPSSTASLSLIETATLAFRPDNLRWTAEGSILAAGHRMSQQTDCGAPLCFDAWEVAEIDPESLEANTLVTRAPSEGFAGATVAIRNDAGIWLGTFHGNRLVFVPAISN